MTMYCFRLIVLVGLVSTSIAPAEAAQAEGGGRPAAVVLPSSGHASSSGPLLASWSFGKWVSGGGRARVVQFCVATMCVALFIMMRKLL
jgi:hypothetical protein